MSDYFAFVLTGTFIVFISFGLRGKWGEGIALSILLLYCFGVGWLYSMADFQTSAEAAALLTPVPR
jgi:hypothetical protein